MILALRRETHLDPDTFVEHLHVDDEGHATLWRSAGWATVPPTPVGRFQATVHIALAEPRADLELLPPPGSPVDTVTCGSHTAVLGRHQEGDEAWAAVVEAARRLLVELTASATAALDLRAGEDGLRLVHVGGSALTLDGSGATARAERIGDDGSVLSEWHLPLAGLPGEAGAGWSLSVDLPHEATNGPGRLRGFASLAILDAGTRRRVSLVSRSGHE